MTGETILITHDAMRDHVPGTGHPERPERLRAIRDLLERAPVPGSTWATASPAPAEIVARVHRSEYVASIAALQGRSAVLDPDTATSPGSVDAAFLAAGAAVQAVDAVFQTRSSRAFALVRPPGHHAELDRAMGFCLFNNAAIAAEHALRAHGCERVLLVDWDVHHGNGTQHLFEARSDVLFFSTHRFPFYPGTGALEETGRGEGEGFTVNAPLPCGAGDGEVSALFENVLAPVADQFRPGLVIVSAGFDAHRDDPLADLAMTEDGFAHLCGVVRGIADRWSDGRLVLVLEGGYDLSALARSVRACVEVLCGATPPAAPLPAPGSGPLLKRLASFHARRWHL